MLALGQRDPLARQKLLFCRCGEEPAVAGLCRHCYRARSHSRARFGGFREMVLERDRACRGCGAGKPAGGLHVHHRVPGRHRPESLVVLCAACHARVHRLSAWKRWGPEALADLWAEQHPGVARQLQLALLQEGSGKPAA